MSKGINRRHFIKAGGATLGAAALSVALSGCNIKDDTAEVISEETKGPQSNEYDFVIVGAGMGGASAALAASEAV